jgi:hypothetical protein
MDIEHSPISILATTAIMLLLARSSALTDRSIDLLLRRRRADRFPVCCPVQKHPAPHFKREQSPQVHVEISPEGVKLQNVFDVFGPEQSPLPRCLA